MYWDVTFHQPPHADTMNVNGQNELLIKVIFS